MVSTNNCFLPRTERGQPKASVFRASARPLRRLRRHLPMLTHGEDEDALLLISPIIDGGVRQKGGRGPHGFSQAERSRCDGGIA